jgi:DNA modification methylase
MLDRRFVGCEMEDKYVQIAARRLSGSIGKYIPTEPKENLLWSE